MNKKRLLKLADFLEKKVKPRWFNLEIVADKGFDKKKCGTAACAMGWMPSCFPRSSLKLIDDTVHEEELMLLNTATGLKFFQAAAEWLGINQHDSYYLFYPGEYPENRKGRMDVVRRIRAFVKRGGRP